MMKQLTTISSPQLFSQLRQNALLITVNNRLARRYADDYNQWMSSESQSVVWPSARILPLNTWLTLQFQSLQDSGLTDLSLLDGFSEKKLWEDIISTEAEKNFMMKASAIARLVMQAWSLMKQWQISLSELSGFSTLESQSLKHWSEKFELTCRRKKLISAVLLPDLISQALSDKQLPCEEQIVFAGFEDPNKLHDCLTDSLEAAGTSVTQLKQDSINQQLVVEKYADTKSEVTAAASWAKSKLLANPSQKLAIVIPSLNENRPWIQTLFNQVLHPERTLPPPYQNMDLFNFSLGIALTDYPLVHDALLTLELIKPEFSLDTLSKILNAQYLFGEPANGANALVQKTSVDLILRKHGRLNWSLDDLIAFCKSHQANHSSIQFEDLISRLETLQPIAAVFKNKQTPESLSRLFLNIWQAMGWPGNKTLNSHEYQQSEKLLQLLQDFQHLKQVNHTLSSTEAIRLFKQLASETIYQEQSEQPPLLISGLLEAAGQQFDGLWLSGLDDQTLPQQTPPNPLIPLSLQKTYDVPHSSAEREFNYAQQLLDHFIANAVDLVISYPAREQDKELRASSLLSKFEHIDKSDNETSMDVVISECLPDLDPDLENESTLSALPEHYPAHGGSSTLTSQAQ